MVAYLESQTEECRLYHMDFHPDQVLISEKGLRVIDWETSGNGNPLMDVVRTVLTLNIGEIPRPTGILIQDLNSMRSALISAYVSQYFSNQNRTGARSSIAWDLAAAIARFDEKIDGKEQQLEGIIKKKSAAFDKSKFQLPA